MSNILLRAGIRTITAIWLLLGSPSWAQEAQEIPRLTRIQKSAVWYTAQEKLWQKEVKQSPGDPNAWYNYYYATRYANIGAHSEKKQKLQRIVEEMGKAIPNTFEYFFCRYFQQEEKDLSLMERAHELAPHRAEVYEEFVTYYELKGDEERSREYWNQFHRSGYIPSSMLDYNYNMLMSTEGNAILFTNGDNDTYPAWMLQRVLGVRESVTIINVALARNRSYLNRLLEKSQLEVDWENIPEPSAGDWISELCKELLAKNPERNIYFACTIRRSHFEKLLDNLYLVGLTYQYSPDRVDNFAVLRNNLERRFRLDYLRRNWYPGPGGVESAGLRMKLNHVIPFMMLYKHYRDAGELERAERWHKLSRHIAAEAKSKPLMSHIDGKVMNE